MSVSAKILVDYSQYQAKDKEIERLRDMLQNEPKRTNSVPDNVNMDEVMPDSDADNNQNSNEEMSQPMAPTKTTAENLQTMEDAALPITKEDKKMPDLVSMALHVPKKYRRLAKTVLTRLENNPKVSINEYGILVEDGVKKNIVFPATFPLLFRDNPITNKAAIRLISILRKNNIVDKGWRKKIQDKSGKTTTVDDQWYK